MTCHDCGGRCSDRWYHPQLTEDYYCARCYVEMIDNEVEEFLAERQDAIKAIRGKDSIKKSEWKLVFS